VALVRTNISEFLHSVFQLQVTADGVPGSLVLSILIMEVLHFSKMLLLTGATWRHIPEDGILRSH
jgi:hypothetical protein